MYEKRLVANKQRCEGEVAHVEVYEETLEIRKETVLREEVRVRLRCTSRNRLSSRNDS